MAASKMNGREISGFVIACSLAKGKAVPREPVYVYNYGFEEENRRLHSACSISKSSNPVPKVRRLGARGS